MAYQTKQQQAVLRCLQERAEECLSAADLSEDLRQSGLTVGLATVYRQLDKLDAYGPETLIQYARQSTQYIFLKAALTGDPLEAVRRWSEQIEYDTENVGKLLEGIDTSQPQMDDKK